MADLVTQILLDLNVKGDGKLEKAFNDVAKAQDKLVKKNVEANKGNDTLVASFAKQKIELKKLGKTLQDAGLNQNILSEAMRGNKVATAVTTKTLSDYIAEERKAQNVRKKGKATLDGLKMELRHYGISVKKVAGWEKLRKKASEGSATAQRILRREVNLAIQAQKKHNKAVLNSVKAQKQQKQSFMGTIFGFRNLRNETNENTMAFSVFRSKLLLASFAMGMYARTIGKLLALSDEQRRAEAQVSRAIETTGFAAGQTLTSIKALGSEMQRLTGLSDALIIKSSAVLLTFTNIAGTAFPRAMKIAVDLSKAFDQDLKQSVIQVGKALNDPILGLTALRRIGVSFNETQKDQVKGFMEINDLASAQAVIFDELEKEVGGVSEAMAKTPLERFNKSMQDLSDIGETVGVGLAVMLKPFQSIFEVLVRWTKEDIEFIGKLVDKQELEEFKSNTDAINAGIKGVRELIVDAGAKARKSRFFEDVISEDFVSRLKTMKLTALTSKEGFEEFAEMVAFARAEINKASAGYKNYVELSVKLDEEWAKAMEKRNDEFNEFIIEGMKNVQLSMPIIKELENSFGKVSNEIEPLGESFEVAIGFFQGFAMAAQSASRHTKEFSEIVAQQMVESLDGMTATTSAMMGLSDSLFAHDKLLLDQRTEDEIQAVLNSRKSEQRKADEIKNIKEQAAIDERKLRAKQKPFMIAEVLSSTAIGIANAQRLAHLYPLNLIVAGMIAATGAAQVATINAQKFAKGGDFIADKPEIIQVGEAGRERVTITPIDRPESRALGSMGGVTVNFSGNVLSQDFIEDEAIPMIKEAIRRGADIGVA